MIGFCVKTRPNDCCLWISHNSKAGHSPGYWRLNLGQVGVQKLVHFLLRKELCITVYPIDCSHCRYSTHLSMFWWGAVSVLIHHSLCFMDSILVQSWLIKWRIYLFSWSSKMIIVRHSETMIRLSCMILQFEWPLGGVHKLVNLQTFESDIHHFPFSIF